MEERIKQLEQRVADLEKKVAAGTTTIFNPREAVEAMTNASRKKTAKRGVSAYS